MLLRKIAIRIGVISTITFASLIAPSNAEPPTEQKFKPGPPRTDTFQSAYAEAVGLAAQNEIDRQVAEYLAAVEAQRLEQERLQREAAAKQAPRRVVHTGGGGGGGDAAACVRAHESDTSGGYSAVNPNGYFGAYQFKQSTWDNTARAMGRYDLVGVRPDQASPADQDAVFSYLYGGGAGASHWAGSGC